MTTWLPSGLNWAKPTQFECVRVVTRASFGKASQITKRLSDVVSTRRPSGLTAICVVGNSCEVVRSILFNEVQIPHFNYVGDSILGFKAHLGAGAVLSNFKSLSGTITVELNGEPLDTGLSKFGALIGDGAEIGCNAVLNPGSIIGRGAVIYPGVNWRGVLPANMIAKNRATVEVVVLRPRDVQP